jgi:predicted MFS family arabinose efflux permease
VRSPSGSPSTPTTRVLGGPTLVLLAAVACFSGSFHTLLPVVPVLLERGGPHGAAGAGTAALFVGTAIGELMTPWLLNFWSPKRLLIGGTLLVAFPSLLYVLPNAPAALMLTAAAIRGFGTGAAIAICIVLLAELAPSNRRGRSIGYFGLATGLTSIVFPSVGVTLLAGGHVALAAFVAFLGGLGSTLLALRLPERATSAPVFATNILGGVRRPGLLAMFGGFALVSCTFGGVITYAPVALAPAGLGSAAVFFAVMGAARAASRWVSGVIGDHQPSHLLLAGGVALTGIGLVALGLHAGPLAVLIAAVAYGMGYGTMQTGSYLAMVERGGRSDSAVTSALWNSATDIGAGAGGTMVGLAAAAYGYATAVWVMPIVLLLSVPVLWSAARSAPSSATDPGRAPASET